MAITYTGNLKLGLPTTGTESGTWGDVVNQQITTLVDQSISGTVSLTSMTNADYTLTNGNGNAANEARYMALLVPSSLTLTAARNIIVPSTSKMYIVKNATTGGYSVTVKTSAGTGIEVPNGNTMLLYCDGTNVIVAFDTMNTVSQNGGQLAGLRNRVINGGMVIDQRNAGASVATTTTGALGYVVDRFAYYVTQASKLTVQQNAGAVTPPAGFSNYLGFTSTSAYSVVAADLFLAIQRIEANNTVDLAWGTANAKAVTLSFKVYSSLTGTFGGAVNSYAGNYTYLFSYSIPVANTWTTVSIQIPGPTAGVWGTGVNAGIQINFSLGAGSTGSGTAGSWSASSLFSVTGAVSVVGTNAATWYVTGVQLEIGSVATTFEQRPYGLELALCQRYYEKSYNAADVPGTAGANGYEYWYNAQTGASAGIKVSYKVTKRAVPSSLSIYSTSGGAAGNLRNVTSGTDVASTTTASGESGFLLQTNAVGALAFYGAHWAAPSEL